jgi:hypothetical protein
MIRFNTVDVEMPTIEPQCDKAWIETVASKYGKTVGELYYYFCSDDKLLEINRERLVSSASVLIVSKKTQ